MPNYNLGDTNSTEIMWNVKETFVRNGILEGVETIIKLEHRSEE